VEHLYTPPKAPKYPKKLVKHSHEREDPFYWMCDREHPELLDYLKKENEYFNRDTLHLEPFRETLYKEMRSRIKEDDRSLPLFKNGFWYQSEYQEGKEYPIYSRFKKENGEGRELLFDVNDLASSYSYYHFKGLKVSPNNQLALYAEDTVSRRQYTLKIKNLETGQLLDDVIENTTGTACWASDNKTFFYVKKDPQTLRSYRVYRHQIGQNLAEDELVFEEDDETFNVGIFKPKSEDYIFIVSSSTLTTEYRFIKSDDPNAPFRVFSKRERGLEYSLDHYQDHFYLLTNKDGATNFKLMKTSVLATDSDHWEEFIPHRPEILLEDVEFFEKFYVLSERKKGLTSLQIHHWEDHSFYTVAMEGETYVCDIHENPEFKTTKLRYYYNSMTRPGSVYEIDMETRETRLLKQQEVLGGYSPSDYISERVWITARDGVSVPVSLVKHKDTPKNAPTLIYGYGSYGHTIDPYFSSTRLSLLDRGFVFAIAHIRGGEYLGREWYETGKLELKNNTFNDFVDASKGLVSLGIAREDRLYAMGGSAGGLLVGAVINTNPELYHGVIAAVPFVDVVTTMLDEDIPLTTGEYDEWGNPNDPKYYEIMLSYSPYDNVQPQNYPNIYVSTGFHDSQVQYWEPAKWVAKLRECQLADHKIYLDTNLETGHGGASGRFEQLKELAKEYAFILNLCDPSLCRV